MAKDGFIFHLENEEDLQDLTIEEKGLIFEALISYAKTGAEPSFSDRAVLGAWRPIRRRIDKDSEAYDKRCETSKQNGAKGGRPKKGENEKPNKNLKNQQDNLGLSEKPKKPYTDTDTDTDTDILKENKKRKAEKPAFHPPTAEEVAEYCRVRELTVNADAFVDFYASKNWMVGKNKMTDWKAACRNWSRSEKKKPVTAQKKNAFTAFEQRSEDYWQDYENELDRQFAESG